MQYGIGNVAGRPSVEEVKAILALASANGVDLIDTACSYGDSESVLGNAMKGHNDFRVITKTPVFKKDCISEADGRDLKDALRGSLSRLRRDKVEGLLVHNSDNLLVKGGEKIFEAMTELKEAGLVEKIGASVYTAEQIDAILARYDIDLVQVPLNVLDQRLLGSGHLSRLKGRGVEIHVRSVFLQGLLLMDAESIDDFFNPIKPLLLRYGAFLSRRGLTALEGCLCFVKIVPEVDYAVVGVDSREQLVEIVEGISQPCNGFLIRDFKDFEVEEPEYLNPSMWRLR
jgi:aryl-alcohol dehydrogenase-like predicted oxidoreductase